MKDTQKESGGRRLSRRGFVFVLLAVAAVFLLVVHRFILPAFLAAITVGLLRPLEEKIGAALKSPPWLTAGVATLVVVLLLLIPLSGVAYLVVGSLVDFAPRFTDGLDQMQGAFDNLGRELSRVPLVGQGVRFLLGEDGVAGSLEMVMSHVSEEATAFARETPRTVLLVLVYLYCLYYFFKDGKKILASLISLIPLARRTREEVVEKLTSVTRGVLKGSLLVGLIEGLLIGGTMSILGIPAAVLWGVLVLFLAFIPGLGPVLVYLPASVALFVSGGAVGGVVLLLVGIGPVGVVDTFVRPYLIGEDIKVHKVLILFGVIGGILVFGIFGFIIGPMVMAVFVQLVELYRETFKQELQEIDAEE
ncbi:MAG: AI-2E family transporter [Spirochaetaceae bacterium]